MLDGRQEWHDAVATAANHVEQLHAELGFRRLLVLGPAAALASLAGCEVRSATPPSHDVNGLIAFVHAGGWDAIVATGTSGPPTSWARLDAVDGDHPVVSGRQWFEFLWSNALPLGKPAKFEIGDPVQLVGEDLVWTVADRRLTPEGWRYQLARGLDRVDATEEGMRDVQAAPADAELWLRDAPCGAADFALTMAHLKLANPLTDTVYAYLSTKTVFRSYQFRPLLRLLASPHQRLLIADEVGLGKTIEAGLIWTELDQRAGVRRALVVCPATLVPKWRSELRRRFDRDVRALDRAALDELVDIARTDGDDPFLGVASLEMLRKAPQLEVLAELAPRFDLVIVDEAHYLRNPLSVSHALGRLLSDWADVLLFLSATPLNLGRDDLFSLVNLLAEEEFADRAVFASQMEPNAHLNSLAKNMVSAASPRQLLAHLEDVVATPYGAITARRPEFDQLWALLDRDEPLNPADAAETRRLLNELNSLASILTRTRKRDVKGDKVVRSAWPINVVWTDTEAALYSAVERWAAARARRANGVVGFATQMPLRQAASCLPALRTLLYERHRQLRPGTADDDFDDLDEESRDDVDQGEGSLGELEDEVRTLLTALGDTDTKFDRFIAHLVELRAAGAQQVMVFSFFRRTLAYLERELRNRGESVRSMHGGVKMDDRTRLMADFRAGRFDILCLSEVGSEGLDFEFCQALVNYDLPWNPMRVEQRIGRLDRFGQAHEKIFILNFHVPGTIETDIFQRLYDRIRVFEESIGELEPILRDELNDLTRVVLDPTLTQEQKQAQAEAVAVAAEAHRRDLDDLAEADGYLSGIDQLLVEGFERDTAGQGRFVGPAEVRTLLDALLEGTRARITGRRGGAVELHGTSDLRDRIVAAKAHGGASRYGRNELLAKINDGEPIPVTFDNDEASRTDVELIGIRHPLVLAAVRHVAATPGRLRRYASLRIEGAPPGRYMVGFWLVRTTGLRPALELWPIAIDIETGKSVPEADTEILRAAAFGLIKDGDPSGVGRAGAELYALAAQELERRRSGVEGERRAANEVLVDARIRARQDGIEIKLKRTREVLDKVRERSIRRMYEGRIRNLDLQREDIVAELDAKRGLAVTTAPAAVALVEIVAAQSGD